MNCLDYQDWLQRRLDGAAGVADSDDAHDHVEACATCRTREVATRRLEDGLRRLSLPSPPTGLAGQIVGRVLAERHRRVRRRRWVAAVTALAASLLLVAAGLALRSYYLSAQPPNPEPTPQVVDTKTPVVVEQAPEHRSARLARKTLRTLEAALVLGLAAEESRESARAPSLRGRVEEVGEKVALLGRQTADQALGQGRILWPIVPGSGLSEFSLGQTFAPSAQSLRGAEEGVTNALSPVTGEARRAVDLFLREVPPLEDPVGPSRPR